MSCKMPKAISLCDKKLRYVAEGNVHLVLEIPDTDFVLRLIKDGEVSLHNIKNFVNFVNKITMPLLQKSHGDYLQIVQFKRQELVNIIDVISHLRPEKRKINNVFCIYALKAPNLTKLHIKSRHNYCIEIKPKEGFISCNLTKHDKCYYCLKQFLKFQENVIDSISSYCPLDLFSGDKKRMKYALSCLLKNPQNNFRIFKDGTLIYNEKSNVKDFEGILNDTAVFGISVNFFLDFVTDVLLNKTTICNETYETFDVSTKGGKCIKDKIIQKESILDKLLSLQKLSENHNFCDINEQDDFGYVSELLNILKSRRLDLNIEDNREKFLTITNPRYLALVSAVFRDCSLMITFSGDICDEKPSIGVGDGKISYEVNITDLEPKSCRTFKKRNEMEKKLLELFEMSKYSINPAKHRDQGKTTGSMATLDS